MPVALASWPAGLSVALAPGPLTASGDGAGSRLVLGPPRRLLDAEKAKQDPSYYLRNTNTETRETLQELYKEFKGDAVLAATMRVPERAKVDQLNAVSRGPLPTWRHSRSVVLGRGLPAASGVPRHTAAWGEGRHGRAEPE